MSIVSLSANSVLATPVQLNPQIREELQNNSLPQLARDAQKTAQTDRTDTITISSQALKMVDARDVSAKETADAADGQRAFRLESERPGTGNITNERISISVYA